jgi:hypothetical protein
MRMQKHSFTIAPFVSLDPQDSQVFICYLDLAMTSLPYSQVFGFFFQVVKLQAFDKFDNTAAALGAATALVESKLSKGLRKFIKEHCKGETLAIADSKLGNIVKEKLNINCVHNAAVSMH